MTIFLQSWPIRVPNINLAGHGTPWFKIEFIFYSLGDFKAIYTSKIYKFLFSKFITQFLKQQKNKNHTGRLNYENIWWFVVILWYKDVLEDFYSLDITSYWLDLLPEVGKY